MKKEDLKIVFLGTPDFAVESLRRIVEGGYNVVGVVTMPDKPAGRGHKMIQSAVKQYAVAQGLHLMQPPRLKDEEFVSHLRGLDADLFVVIAFRMLPEAVWSMPRLGTFNLHASLLPRYRGAAPINWAVINGDTRTGVTTFFLKHEIDTGDIIAQECVEILPTDNVGDVHDKLMMLGADLTITTIDDIIAGTLTTRPQEEGEFVPAPKIFKETCEIDWNMEAERVHNLVRGLSPYPGAWTTLFDSDKRMGSLKIFATEVCDISGKPGAIVPDGDGFSICCGSGGVRVLSVQLEGKRRMDCGDFVRGMRLLEGNFRVANSSV